MPYAWQPGMRATADRLAPGQWTDLDLETNVEPVSGSVAQYRLEGDLVRLRGRIQKTSGNIQRNETLATVPSGARPPETEMRAAGVTGLTPRLCRVTITSGGELSANVLDSTSEVGSSLDLSGLTWIAD